MGESSDEEASASKRCNRDEDLGGARKKHAPSKFSAKLEKEFPWIQPVPSDPFRAECKVCPTSSTGRRSTFRCERSDICRHAATEKHVGSARTCKFGNSQKMLSFLRVGGQQPLNQKVKFAEMKLAGYVAAHDEPFRKLDHLVEVLKEIFPDSEIAQNIALKRTKVKGVVLNVLGQDEKENLSKCLQEVKFSILTDESTDIASVKTSCIIARFYHKAVGKIVSRFWELEQVFSENDPAGAIEGATAEKLFRLIIATFEKYEIPFSNVIGFGSDGCSVMMGCNNSVATKMKELCPGIRIVKCICHSLHLCASEACKSLPRDCEDLARNIYNFLKSSAKRRAQLAEFQTFLELDVLRMLHPSQTRWLSLTSVVQRLINQWDALRLFFDSKWLEEKLESAERIHIWLNDPVIKGYFLFLEWILPDISGMNEYFQSEKSVATFVHDKMVKAYKEILSSFMKREYVCRTPINEIRPDDESRWLPVKQIYLGVGVADQIEIIKREGDQVDVFKETCRNFLSVLCVQMKQRYDFADPVLERLRCLAPEAALSQRERENTPSLLTLALLLPRVVDRADKAKLQRIDNQWRELPFYKDSLPDSIKEETRDVEKFWHELNVFENEVGETPFSELASFSLEALSIPIANADCERKFSKINDIKTKKRNRLITRTVNGILHADSAVRASGGCCMAFKPRQSMYDKMTAATIYRDGTVDDDNVENVFAEDDDVE